MKIIKNYILFYLLGFSIFFINISNAQANLTIPQLTIDEVLLDDIGNPWAFTFINANEIIFTEKAGKLWKYSISTQIKTEIIGLPVITQNGQGGLLDVELHPNFIQNQLVYLTYVVSDVNGQTTALGKGKLENNQLIQFEELFRALPMVNSGAHFGGRITFDKDNFVYFSMGDRGTPANAQNKKNHAGKIMRLKDDGTIPSDNPFVDSLNACPEIFSWGHRNVQGLAMNPITGEVYAHEHGPKGGDELNLIKKGVNYGWPLITFGVNYDGSTISLDTARIGLEQPLTYWVPSIAPSGLTFIQNNQLSNEIDVLIGALAGKHLHWLKLKDNKKVLASKSMEGYARFRDVQQSPDGKLYAMTESPNQLVRLKSNIIITSLNQEEKIKTAIIYPNPSSDQITLQFFISTLQNVSIQILTIDGRLIKQIVNQKFLKGNHQLSLKIETLPEGIYYLKIRKGEKSSFLKWIKK